MSPLLFLLNVSLHVASRTVRKTFEHDNICNTVKLKQFKARSPALHALCIPSQSASRRADPQGGFGGSLQISSRIHANFGSMRGPMPCSSGAAGDVSNELFEEVTSAEHFDRMLEETDESTLIVLSVHASWCKGCKEVAPILDKLSRMWPHIKWVKLDADKNKALLKRLKIESFPRVQMYRGKDGLLIEFTPSAQRPQNIKKSIQLVDRDTEHMFMVNGGQVCATPMTRSNQNQ